jgi:hypothetical protein
LDFQQGLVCHVAVSNVSQSGGLQTELFETLELRGCRGLETMGELCLLLLVVE